jgi:putative methionine-R-sulfoxide reductase with GAF domain
VHEASPARQAAASPPARSDFEKLLRRRDRARRTVRIERNLDLLTDALETLETKAENVNPEKALKEVLKFWRKVAPIHVLDVLDEKVGELAEEFQAKLSWLYVPRGNQLVALAVHGYLGERGVELALGGPGIVPMVANTKEAYCVGDVSGGRDKYYVPANQDVRSEQAVPIIFKNELLGVLNQESPYPGTFSPATAKALQQRSIRLVPHLLAYNAHALEDDSAYCAWNPDLHGWHFRSFLNVVLTQFKRRLKSASAAIHLTVWYADPVADTVFALATTGYGKARLGSLFMELQKTFAGKMALEPDGHVGNCKWNDPIMLFPDFDRLMGLTMLKTVTIQSCYTGAQDGSAKQPGLVLSFYVCDKDAERSLPDDDQLKKMANLLQAQFAAYLALRPRLAAAQIEQALRECPETSEQFPDVAAAIARVLDVQGMTILARPEASQCLHLVAATAPLVPASQRDLGPDAPPRRDLSLTEWSDREPEPIEFYPAPPPRARSLIPSPYTVGDESYSGWFARQPGIPVYRNAPGKRYTLPGRKLPDDCPVWPSRKLTEHLSRVTGTFRRVAGYGVEDIPRQPPSGLTSVRPTSLGCDGVEDMPRPLALGVFRGIRSIQARPFTLCDLTALREMAEACADEFYAWRDWYAHAMRTKDHPTIRDRLHQPVPRSHNRPAQALAREILVDVHDLLRATFEIDCVLQVAVLVEHTESDTHPLQVFAYHSELASTAPPSGSRCAPDALRVPGITWEELLEGGEPKKFKLEAGGGSLPVILAGARVPFWSWCGRHVQRGILTVDLTQGSEFGTELLHDLETAARKLAAVFATDGSEAAHARPIEARDPHGFLAHLAGCLGTCSLALGPADGDDSQTPRCYFGERLPEDVAKRFDDESSLWFPPMIVLPGDAAAVDPDAQRWGVSECSTDHAEFLRVPLRLGARAVGEIIAGWNTSFDSAVEAGGTAGDHAERNRELRRAHRIRDVVALWNMWTWSMQDRSPFQQDAARDKAGTSGAAPEPVSPLPAERHPRLTPAERDARRKMVLSLNEAFAPDPDRHPAGRAAG